MRASQFRFILQQGFPAERASTELYAALMFQPRVIGVLVVLGNVFQSTWLFVALSAVLWWSTFVPTQNPFDAVYHRVVAGPRGRSPLGVPPGPRLFAEGMGATVTLAIGAALLLGAVKTAWALEAVTALGDGRRLQGLLWPGVPVPAPETWRRGYADQSWRGLSASRSLSASEPNCSVDAPPARSV